MCISYNVDLYRMFSVIRIVLVLLAYYGAYSYNAECVEINSDLMCVYLYIQSINNSKYR